MTQLHEFPVIFAADNRNAFILFPEISEFGYDGAMSGEGLHVVVSNYVRDMTAAFETNPSCNRFISSKQLDVSNALDRIEIHPERLTFCSRTIRGPLVRVRAPTSAYDH